MVTDSDESRSYRWLISGRVQGVGFRWFVYRAARGSGLAGWARNLRDGSVEVVGQGTEQALEALDRLLRKGPSMSSVEHVEKCEVTPEVNSLKSFEIR